MNILPHKSWHVRTKKNIARVREDERKAAEEEKEIKRRIALADQEAKINLLRERAGFKRPNETSSEQSTNTSFDSNEHVNFFKELEDGKYTSTNENAERAEEKKQEKEKYEKQIGYLTYLGQDTNEALRKRDWYEMLPDRTDKRNEDGFKIEVSLQSKLLQDPLTLMHRYMGTSSSSSFKSTVTESEKKQPEVKKYESLLTESLKNYRLKKRKRKHSTSSTSSKDTSPSKNRKNKSKKKKSRKKHRKSSKHSSSDSSDSSDEELKRLKQQKLEALRIERLNREKIEREKAENLLRKLRGETEPKQQQPEVKSYKQKFNSQFNPEIARQNQD